MIHYLSKYVKLDDFEYSETAIRLGIKNELGAIELANAIQLCEDFFDPIYEKLGYIHITSGYRCPELNAKIGGSKSSAHMTGNAVDFVFPNRDLKSCFNEIVDSGLKFDQLIMEFNSWIHLGRADKPRGQVLIAGRVNGSTVYTFIEHL